MNELYFSLKKDVQGALSSALTVSGTAHKLSRAARKRHFLKGRVVDDKNGLTKKTELNGIIQALNADLPRGRDWTIDLSARTCLWAYHKQCPVGQDSVGFMLKINRPWSWWPLAKPTSQLRTTWLKTAREASWAAHCSYRIAFWWAECKWMRNTWI